MHNAETGSNFTFSDFSASKLRQPATETFFSGHNLNNQQLKHRRCFTYDYTQNQLKTQTNTKIK